jgi:hypothetical protein
MNGASATPAKKQSRRNALTDPLRRESRSIAVEFFALPQSVDYAVEPGKKLLITIITNEQYRQIATGHKLEGAALLRAMVSGKGKESVQMTRGNYFVAFNDMSGTGIHLSYRASFR